VQRFVTADELVRKHSPGAVRVLSSKIEQNAPEKKMPSTQANAIQRSPKVDCLSEIHFFAQSPLVLMQGTSLTALNSWALLGIFDVSVDQQGVSLWMFSIAIWKP
jgi:hypothetical protein